MSTGPLISAAQLAPHALAFEAQARELAIGNTAPLMMPYWSDGARSRLIAQRQNLAPDGRALVPVVHPAFDDTGVIHRKTPEVAKLFEDPRSSRIRAVYYQAATPERVLASLEEATREQQADVTILFAHGNPQGMRYGEGPGGILWGHKLEGFRELAHRFRDGGMIFLSSCSTAGGRDINFALQLSLAVPHVVVSAAVLSEVEGSYGSFYDERAGELSLSDVPGTRVELKNGQLLFRSHVYGCARELSYNPYYKAPLREKIISELSELLERPHSEVNTKRIIWHVDNLLNCIDSVPDAQREQIKDVFERLSHWMYSHLEKIELSDLHSYFMLNSLASDLDLTFDFDLASQSARILLQQKFRCLLQTYTSLDCLPQVKEDYGIILDLLVRDDECERMMQDWIESFT